MDLPPYQWRADSGYRPPSVLPVPAPTIMACPHPYPYAVPGPIPVQAIVAPQHVVCSYPKSTASKAIPTPPPPPEKKAEEAPAEKKDGDDRPKRPGNAKSSASKASSSSSKSSKSSASKSSGTSGTSSKTAATSTKSKSPTSSSTSKETSPAAKKKAAPPSKKVEAPSTTAKLSPTIIPPRPTAANAPPRLRAGTNYMFASEHTILHVLNRAAKVWEKKFEGAKFQFQIFTASTTLPVNDVIQNVMRAKVGSDYEKCKGWAVTEVVEKGDGVWLKGTTIEYGSLKGGGTLGSMGWGKKRGDSLPPVWVTVHRV